MEPGTPYWTALLQAAYDLHKWELQWLSKMPKSYRYGLGQQLESSGMLLLTNLIDARYGINRKQAAAEALRISNHHRYQLRLACDLSLMTAAQQEHAHKYLIDIGRSLAAIMKTLDTNSIDAQ
jgi:hypothetical protein